MRRYVLPALLVALGLGVPGFALAQAQPDAPGAQPSTSGAPPGAAGAQPAAPGVQRGAPGAKAYFIWPKNGQVINGGKFWVRMGLRNFGIAPAGVVKPGTGHHHLLVDTDIPPQVVEIDAAVSPGTHTLQLVLADQEHVPHDPPVVSEKITITVR